MFIARTIDSWIMLGDALICLLVCPLARPEA